MELFIVILLLVIFAEVSALAAREFTRKRMPAKNSRRKLFVDTSALMDGRILSVAKAGFLGDEVLIPRSVIRELQLLADGSDSEKRTRARFGLDIVNELERVELADVEIYHDEGDRVKVDERLIELAKENHGIIMTNDFNLAKVATAEHIDVININELAQGLRSEYLPGDKLSVKIISAGANPRQGVAYLPDGTMIVVDEAQRYAGKNQFIEIEFVRYLQTAAGKMMFAKLSEQKRIQKEQKAPKKTATGRKYHKKTK
ncbi:MAG: hypothetical protein MJ154_02100 [Candidatus Saccharibacteria bacterium]|nr:hypothetical protein [Candidatus Saccharibacteria bacterium]